jgi:hypothetical protein
MPTPQPEPQYVRTIRAAALLFWGFGGMAISLAGLAAIAYFAITEQWAAAIFALLARKELVRWMQEKFDEIDEEVKRINSAV